MCSQSVNWKRIVGELKKQFPDYPVYAPEEVEKPPTWTIDTQPLKV